MNLTYRSLFTVGVEHEFRGGACDDLVFVVPTATRAVLDTMRALVRERAGVLHLLIAVDGVGGPLGECSGQRLIFGLAPRSPHFTQYTEPFALAPWQMPLFANETRLDRLDAVPRGVELFAPAPQIAPQTDERPLDLRVSTRSGLPIACARLEATDSTWWFREGLVPGEFELTETAADGRFVSRRLVIEPSLASAGCWGLLAITLDEAQVAGGAAFTLSLAARSDVLRYYVVVKPTSDADFESIAISDNGATEDGRSQPIGFRRVLPPFDRGRLPADLLDASGSRRIVMFEAEAAVRRRARGPHGIELHRNGEVLIGNLPQPGAERSDAQFVVHLSKP